ncbi:cyclase family protein [Amycolatopsis pithecellobii]|uniref:cyclase family protein n=1 Tax=Amycolatopsis pithecellobii TaxID=664692 RepID=UPI001AA0AF96|nr:cyclase family protein [Amycolatopsis pithecellobii]
MTRESVDPQVEGLLGSLSNWGRWGTEDQLGTLNHITAESRLAAVKAVRTGETVSCSRDISPRQSKENPSPLLHHMIASGEGAPEEGLGIAADWLGLAFHGYSVTHLDSLSHLFWNKQSYNGRPASDVSTVSGAATGSVEVARNGIVTRGVLLDLAGARGQEWLEPGEALTPADLERAEREQGVSVGRGDVLLVRTGRDARRAVKGPIHPDHEGAAGLHFSCLPYLHERQIAVLGSDAVNDVVPSGVSGFEMPVHTVALVAMGLWLLDNAYLDELGRRCRDRGAWDFLAVLAPLLLKRSTGSPINPLAVL